MFKRSGEKIKSVGQTIFSINSFIAGIILIAGFVISFLMSYGGGVILFLAIVLAGAFFCWRG